MSDYTVDNLSVDIKASADSGIMSMEKLLGSVIKVDTQLEKMTNKVGLLNIQFQELKTVTSALNKDNNSTVDIFKRITNESSRARAEVSGLSKEMQGLAVANNATTVTPNLDASKVAKNFNLMFSIGKVFAFTRATKGLFNSTIKGAMDMTENYNLFDVAMGNVNDRAMIFQDNISNSLNINKAESLRYQGFFMALSKNMDIATDSAYKMSENLTKVVYDLSSLYNIDVDKAFSKLQSGMIGQTKPLRELGIDVTAQTLQRYLDDFDMSVQIQQLTQAEKVMLRYIAVLDQSSMAHGDMALTLQNPSNQLRTFTQVTKEAGAWLGTLFLGALGDVMTVGIGVAMVIRDVTKAVATLMGFNLGDFGFGGARATLDLSDYNDELSSVGTNLSGIGKNASEAKKEMLKLAGFEDINNITTPTDPTATGLGGGATLGSGSYYDQLVGKLGEYDNLMFGISDKAKGVRNSILDWLGFQYRINDATGELLGLKWGGFKEMSTSAKILTLSLGGLGALKIGSVLLGGIKGIGTGIGVALKGVDLLFGTKTLDKAKNLVKVFGTNIKDTNLVKGLATSVKETGLLGSTALTAVGGLVALGGGLLVASDGAKVLARDGELSNESMLKLGGGMASATAGGAMLGSIIPGIGTAFGAVTGAIVGGLTALYNYSKETERLRYEMELFDGLGIPIEDWTVAITDSMGAITGAHKETVKWIDAHKESQTVLGQTTTSLDTLYSKLTNNAYKVSGDDIDYLNQMLEQMTNGVKTSGEAFTNATINMVNKLVEEGKISQDTADKVVANAIRKAEAEGEYVKSYELKMKDLATQLEKGTISQSNYRIEVEKLNTEFNKMMKPTEDLAFNLDQISVKASQRINVGNYKLLEQSVKDISTAYVGQVKELDNANKATVDFNEKAIQATKDQLSELEKKHGKESDLYKATELELESLMEVRKGLTSQFEEESIKLDTIVAQSFGSIISQLHSTGEKLTPEAQAISDDIVSTLSAMGYEVDFETGIISSLVDGKPQIVAKFSEVGKESGQGMRQNVSRSINDVNSDINKQNPKINIGADTAQAMTALNTYLDGVKKRKAYVTVDLVPGKSVTVDTSRYPVTGYGASIGLYADGGLPDVGEMFIAREQGPELVGSMGGRSAVANNAQIVEGIEGGVARGVYQAMAGFMNQSNNSTENNVYMFPNQTSFGKAIIEALDHVYNTNGIKPEFV